MAQSLLPFAALTSVRIQLWTITKLGPVIIISDGSISEFIQPPPSYRML